MKGAIRLFHVKIMHIPTFYILPTTFYLSSFEFFILNFAFPLCLL